MVGIRRRPGRARAAAVTGLFLLQGLLGCRDMLEVELPGRIPASTLDDPALAPTLVQSAIADFECAFVNYVVATGLLTDELYISTEFIAPSLWDQRRIAPDNGNLSTGVCTSFGFGLYTPLQTARYVAELAIAKIEGFPDAAVPNKATLLATAHAYAGYAYTLLGEGFCEVTIDIGPILQPAQVLQRAETRFTQAIELARSAGAQEIERMALVGRARVRLDLGRGQEAAADARQVPPGFVRNATYSGTNQRRWNLAYTMNHRDLMISVDPRYRNLEVGGVPDPRVPVRNMNRPGHDGVTPLWVQLKYTAEGSPIPLASGDEAQLIIAEVEGGATAVTIINALRARHGLPPFAGGSEAQIRAQVLVERSRELYLEGHRLNDMLRHRLPFDTGVNHKGVPYGDTTCLPLPSVEREQNPNAR